MALHWCKDNNPGGLLCVEFLKALQEKKKEEIEAGLFELLKHPDIGPLLRTLIPKMQAILAGSHDTELAADPELDYTDAVEILFLLERLDD